MPRKTTKEKKPATTTKTTTSTRKAKDRSDYMPNKTHEERGALFDKIWKGEHDVYYFEDGEVKKNWRGQDMYCWQLMSRGQLNKDGTRRQQTPECRKSVGSMRIYRLAMDWALYTNPGFWKHPSKIPRLKESINRVLTKYGDHSCHKCGNDWCANPRHLRIDTRVSNEVDKHFHFFLNHADPTVRQKFRTAFPDLMKEHSVW